MKLKEDKPEISRAIVEQMVDIAERLNYKLLITTKAGFERVISYREIAMVMRDRIEMFVRANGKIDEPIMFSDIDEIKAGTPESLNRPN